jgi:hypothetical protein
VSKAAAISSALLSSTASPVGGVSGPDAALQLHPIATCKRLQQRRIAQQPQPYGQHVQAG